MPAGNLIKRVEMVDVGSLVILLGQRPVTRDNQSVCQTTRSSCRRTISLSATVLQILGKSGRSAAPRQITVAVAARKCAEGGLAKGSFIFRSYCGCGMDDRITGDNFLLRWRTRWVQARFAPLSSNLINGWPAGSSKLAVTNMIRFRLMCWSRRRAKEPARERDVSQDRDLILYLLNVLADQAADHDGLAVIAR